MNLEKIRVFVHHKLFVKHCVAERLEACFIRVRSSEAEADEASTILNETPAVWSSSSDAHRQREYNYNSYVRESMLIYILS